MKIQNVVEKFADETVLGRWILPPEAIPLLAAHVFLNEDGAVIPCWDLTSELAVIVQPWVDEEIDLEGAGWLLSGEQAPRNT